MNESEKQIIRDRKARGVKLLRREWRKVRASGLLHPADARLAEYLDAVATQPKRHNLYEIVGAAVFLMKAQQYVLDFDAVRRFIRFYEVLPFDGTQGITSYRMTPVQVFIVTNIFGLKTYNNQGNLVRLHRDVYLFVPRKFAKTTFASSIAVWFMLFESFNSQAFVISNSYEQSKVCFDMQRRIMQSLDPDGKTFRVNRERIFFESGARASYSRCLAANPKNLDGLFAELVIRDEGAQARDTQTKSGSELKNVLTSSEGPREQPLNIDISTASEVIDGPFYREIEGVKDMFNQLVHSDRHTGRKTGGVTGNDHLFGLLFMPDVDDEMDSPVTWAKVQPHLGITVQPDYYEKEWQRAQLTADNMLTYRTKLLNIFTRNEAQTWISSDVIRRAAIQFDPLNPGSIINEPGVEAKMAVDLSINGDFSVVGVAIHIPRLKQVWMHCRYFVPDGRRVWLTTEQEGAPVYKRYDDGMILAEEAPYDGQIHSNHENRYLYQHWVDEGHLQLTHGEKIDYEDVADYAFQVMQQLQCVTSLGYDQYRSKDFVNRLAARMGSSNGLMPYSQQYSAFTGACQWFNMGLSRGGIFIDANPINAYCVGNATLGYSADELNCKPEKIDPRKRIDGLIVMLMCAGQFENIGHRVRDNDFDQ